MNIHTDQRTHTHSHTHIYIHTHTHIHTHTYTHAHAHTHTHTQTKEDAEADDEAEAITGRNSQKSTVSSQVLLYRKKKFSFKVASKLMMMYTMMYTIVIFHKRATNCRALLQKMNCKDKVSYFI